MQLRLVVAVIAAHLSPEGQHLRNRQDCRRIMRNPCVRACWVQRAQMLEL